MRSDEHPGALQLETDLYSRASERLQSGASFSGHERNHVFLNRNGDDYVEVSGISGLDHPGDSRAFAVLDFDRDGWQDLAVVNANAPLFQLFRNRMGERGDAGRMVAIRFEGGNRFAFPASEWSSRDAYGARVILEVEGRELLREHRAGEGLAAQNSATLHVGIGDAEEVTRLEVRWPSGRRSDATAVPAGTLVTAYEDPSASPTGAPFVLTPYRVRGQQPAVTASVEPIVTTSSANASIRAAQDVLPGERARLILYTTVATWCAPCLAELPSLDLLRTSFTSAELEIFGVPYDPEESPEVLAAWSARYEPPYRILSELKPGQRNAVIQGALEALRIDGLPAAVVTDSEGEVLLVRWGPPSVSELRVLLENQEHGK
ncbi:MAG: ASPIC/UnbV domain-containing protein [Gammaproteobacteria bacterium]|nr:ASPIC/UnbV domain-containing protein [Gammaproteobacteria bacterium]MDE0259895.1 ASPIC/UnbV domain-containing protein [Gammaproteobacteria bacterium]